LRLALKKPSGHFEKVGGGGSVPGRKKTKEPRTDSSQAQTLSQSNKGRRKEGGRQKQGVSGERPKKGAVVIRNTKLAQKKRKDDKR